MKFFNMVICTTACYTLLQILKGNNVREEFRITDTITSWRHKHNIVP